ELPGSYHITATLSAVPPSALNNYIITNNGATFSIGYGTCTGGNPRRNIYEPDNIERNRGVKNGGADRREFTECGAYRKSIGPDPSPVFATGYGSVQMITYSRGTVGGVNETIVNDIPDSAFRWSSDKWIFNMVTSNLNAPATYTFRINLKGPLATPPYNSYIEFTIGTK